MSNLSVVQKEAIVFDQSKVDLIRKTVARDLTPNEFDLFISIAKARGLDPILNQIHAVVRGDGEKAKVNFQVGIDGLRLIAARTGEFAGRDETIFEYKSGTHHPERAKVTVYRFVNGVKCAWTASAKWDEYFPGDKLGFMWKKLPETMLEKCAEAKALRMAFPNDLSGLYVNEEMDQAEAQKPNHKEKSPQLDIAAEFEELDAEEQSHNLGEFVFGFGLKFRGKKLKEIEPTDLRDYIAEVNEKLRAQKKTPGEGLKAALEMAETYLKSLELVP